MELTMGSIFLGQWKRDPNRGLHALVVRVNCKGNSQEKYILFIK